MPAFLFVIESSLTIIAAIKLLERFDGLNALNWFRELGLSPQLRIQYVAQTIAQQIDTENRDEDRQAGKNRKPRSAVHITPAFAQHGAPGWNARWYAETEKTQAGFGDDDDGHSKGSDHGDAGKGIGHHVLKENVKVLAAQRLGGGDKIAFLQRQNLATHHPTVLDPATHHQRQNDIHDTLAQESHQGDGE